MNAVDALLAQVRARVRSSRVPQYRIAGELGISEKHLSMFMQGRSNLSYKLLGRLCELVGLVELPASMLRRPGFDTGPDEGGDHVHGNGIGIGSCKERS